ncbi:glycosyltransferase [Pseudomonas asiatica]|uniref:glycosyltransferase family 2 protein n=1 Tax=Pseudomonas asiatica TaxID=2219225 RepID=UPI0023667AD5|nr:glycosyltransferase [Pseudomonas asiatica]MDD1984026.1 glycosyltransferase [Pseudomonas asiatica]WDM90753.1 glycosyltransferase [Pseudomonas asiatica]
MTQDLMEKPQAGQQPASTNRYTGAIIGLQGDVLQGWAADTEVPELRPVVEVFVDGTSVALARADQYEPLAPVGDQFHGFTVQLRKSWLAEARLITAQIANQAIDLPGQVHLPSPLSQEVSAVTSQIWHTGGLRIGGWAWDPRSPRRHIEVTVREGDKIICTSTCNLHNQALAYRDSSDHGLAIDLPWELADGKVHVLDIVSDLGQPLAGSPIRVCCWPEGVEGLLRKLDPSHDAATVGLLATVAKEQALRLPTSVGWRHYPQWFEAFQRLDGLDRPPMRGKVGLLLIGESNPVWERASLDSLGDDLAQVLQRVTTSANDVLPAIQQLVATGCDRVLPLMIGDRIASGALPYLSSLLDDGSGWAFADCDHDGANGERSLPWLKPVWDIDLFIGADVFTPGAIFCIDIVKLSLKLLETVTTWPKLSWYDFTAAIALATHYTNASVAHLPRVLYHRANHLSLGSSHAEPSSLRVRAMEWLCQALDSGSKVSQVADYPALLRAHWSLPEKMPMVSLIVPTRDQYNLLHACIEGLLNQTDYPQLEVIVVNNQSSEPETLAYLRELEGRGVVVLNYPHQFNYSSINNHAASIASGEIIGLINNDIEVLDGDWLKEMVSQLCRPGVGVVGAKLLWPIKMVQHAGVTIGVNGLAAHIGNLWHDKDCGYLGLNQICRRMSAVTAACLLTKKEIFQSVGGLDAKAFPVAFNDVDYCLKILAMGHHIIWTPFAKLIHAESASRGKDVINEKKARALREQELFMLRWSLDDFADAHYHPALSSDYLSGPYGALALPPRTNQIKSRFVASPIRDNDCL